MVCMGIGRLHLGFFSFAVPHRPRSKLGPSTRVRRSMVLWQTGRLACLHCRLRPLLEVPSTFAKSGHSGLVFDQQLHHGPDTRAGPKGHGDKTAGRSLGQYPRLFLGFVLRNIRSGTSKPASGRRNVFSKQLVGPITAHGPCVCLSFLLSERLFPLLTTWSFLTGHE